MTRERKIPIAPTVDEWQTAVAAASRPGVRGEDGWTVRELCDHFDKSESTVRRDLRRLLAFGTVVCCHNRIEKTISGLYYHCPSYIFLKKEKPPNDGIRERPTKGKPLRPPNR